MARKSYSLTSDAVLSSFISVLNENDDERTFRYVHPETDRTFHVHRSLSSNDEFRFKLAEVTPSNRIAKFNEQGYCISSEADPRLDAIEKSPGPNYFIEECHRLKIDVSSIVFGEEGYGTRTIFHETIESCAHSIARAIITNTRHVGFDTSPLPEAVIRAQEATQLEDSRMFWSGAKVAAVLAQERSQGIFKGCHNMMGKPLSAEARTLILNYLNNPSQELWNDVRGTIIAGSKTLWQAWVEVDHKANRSGSVGYPCPETLREAMRNGVKTNMERIDRELEEMKSPASPSIRLV